jgi:dihydropteroate synthase
MGILNLNVIVFEDGRRIFSSKDILKHLGLNQTQRTNARVLNAFLRKIMFISIGNNELRNRLDEPIKFIREAKVAYLANGYMAETHSEICNAVLKLANKMLLLPLDLQAAAERKSTIP